MYVASKMSQKSVALWLPQVNIGAFIGEGEVRKGNCNCSLSQFVGERLGETSSGMDTEAG